MLVITRFEVADEAGEEFVGRAHAALRALGACPGFVRGRLGRAVDEPGRWCLTTEWESVGAYRRALGAFDVKMHATPLLAGAVDEAGAYEILAAADGPGELTVAASDRAPGGASRFP